MKKKRQWKYVWKVVRLNEEDKMTSIVVHEGPYCLKYSMRHRTKAVPGTDGVLVFEDQFWAQQFADRISSSYTKVAILRCTYTGEPKVPEHFVEPGTLRNLERRLARSYLFRRYLSRYSCFPSGTLAVASVVPVFVEKTYRN